MKRKGVNPKSWFYGLRDTLVSERNRPCVFAGAACEQWLNGELFRVIAHGLRGTRLTAYPEWNGRQHDVVVIPHGPNDPRAWRRPVAVVESKILYPSYSLAKRAQYIERLIEQLCVPHVGMPVRVGFLVGVFAYWPEHRALKETFGQFRRSIGALLRSRVKKGTAGFAIEVDHSGAMETFLDERKSKIGAAQVVVGCVAQYVKLVGKGA